MAGPRRGWGWHQLDAAWADRLVADARIGRGDLVIDVGAGRGAITAPLLDAGARVIAVEAHAERAAFLRARFGPTLIVVQADASDLWLPRRPFHVVANPPFGVTTALLRRLLQPGSRLVQARIVLQDAAARQWVGPSAPAATRWQRTFVATLGRRVPRAAFQPRPRVDCRVLELRRR